MKILKIQTSLICLSILINFSFGQLTPKQAIAQMQRGINIGNTLDCPTEGSWGNGPLKEYYFDDYKNAGFTCIRIPITWDGHVSKTAPYAINATWLNRVEQVIDWGLKRKLIIIINAHHEGWIKTAYTDANKTRFDSIWSQIASRFKNKSDSLLFEMINEPNGLTLANINDLNARTLQIIRKTNPTRIVLFSGNVYANSAELVQADVPADNYLIGYYHSYDPYPFGLNGPGSYGSDADIATTTAKFTQVANWGVAHNVPVILGEFGYQKKCEYNSRMLAYATVVEKSLEYNVAFSAWDDGGDFTIYQRSQRKWNDIKDILIYTYSVSPSKLMISQPDTNRIILNWINRTTENDSIVVERKTGTADFDTIAIIGPEMNNFIDSLIAPKTTYYYRLQTNIRDSITPMSVPISISLPYFTKLNKDTTVTDSFKLQLQKVSDPDIADEITYKVKLINGASVPNWMTFDATNVTLCTNTRTPAAGEYKIILTAKDRSGQVAVDTFTLTMEVTVSGINEPKDQDSFTVYPNPASGRITVSWPLITGNIELSLVDYLGRTVLAQKIEDVKYQTSYDLDISDVPSGVYILRINSNNSVLCKKIYVNN
jgi:hypothetical protein